MAVHVVSADALPDPAGWQARVVELWRRVKAARTAGAELLELELVAQLDAELDAEMRRRREGARRGA